MPEAGGKCPRHLCAPTVKETSALKIWLLSGFSPLLDFFFYTFFIRQP